MYDYLKGTLAENGMNYAVVDVQGVGYKVLTPIATLSQPQGSACMLYTSFVVRENAHTIYGFRDSSTRNLFEVLINVSGVGPKTALCILSQFSASQFQEAILNGNTTLISSVPGLGKKTSEKLILDLKDKIAKLPTHASSSDRPLAQNHHDAIQALVNLGFTEKNASKAIDKVTSNGSKQLELSEMITQVLRQN